ncbi:Superoxide dismutase (Mn) [uncultured delta proteobacterium]|uniref:Superoxide dismutase n=1 Tax=uncultured delta proteobacterium TaxID=34034 RepID=A0A212KAA6_9DELT|nr:Superoxide dismutase (Mn) [uncultured delta proteobacterium]
MFARIQLPYGYDALEPHLGADVIKVHYDAHHKTYMEKFNDLVKDVPAFSGMDARKILENLEKAPDAKRDAIRNNGGGFYNHNLYFESMTPKPGDPPSELKKTVEKRFGSIEKMLEELREAATAKVFGSGWAWLVHSGGKLDIAISPNQDLPKRNPALLLPVDMWEHAYYLQYKNKKADYVDAFFNVINWDVVSRRMREASS